MEALTSLAPIIQAGTGGLGLISNMIQGNRQGKLQSAALNQYKQLQALASNPALLAAKIQALQQPLNQGLVSAVGNETQGVLAERGLGGSPQINQQVTEQALAPYQLNEQQLAMQALFQALGLPLGAIGTGSGTLPNPAMTNTSGLFQQLQGQKPETIPVSTGGPSVFPPGITGPDPNAGPDPTPPVVPGLWPGWIGDGSGGGSDTQFPGAGDLY